MTGSRSSHEKPNTKSRLLYAGHHLYSIRSLLANLFRKFGPPPVLMSIGFTTRQHRFGFTRLFVSHLPTSLVDFSLALTTHALNIRRLRWFGAGFRQQTHNKYLFITLTLIKYIPGSNNINGSCNPIHITFGPG